MKAIKNETEIRNIRDAFLRDSIAMCHLLAWFFRFLSLVTRRLEAHIDEHPTEFDVAAQSTAFRRRFAQSLGDSFAPIVGCGANAAIVHYEPTSAASSARLQRDTCVLLDTGGQYRWGTTDITRTVCVASDAALSRVDPAFRECYTAVLKGHIALATAVFPARTRGVQLDVLARRALWERGLDYGHGTGHGVGYCLGVHEGPEVGKGGESEEKSVSTRTNAYKEGFAAGMTMTDEPGYYDEERGFGVRIENTLHILEEEEKEGA